MQAFRMQIGINLFDMSALSPAEQVHALVDQRHVSGFRVFSDFRSGVTLQVNPLNLQARTTIDHDLGYFGEHFRRESGTRV